MTKTAKPAKSVITEPMKLFIVRQIAAYDPPAVVAAAVLEEFKVKLTSQQIERYNPERAAGKDLGAKLKAEFYRARKAFEEDLDGIPEAKKAVRVRMLAQAARSAQTRGNHAAMADHLERIAKEVGGTHEGKRQVTVDAKVAGKVKHEHSFSAEQNAALLREALGALADEALAAGTDGSGPAE